MLTSVRISLLRNLSLFWQINEADLNRYWRNVPLPEPHLSLLAGGFFLQRVRPWRLSLNRRIRHLVGWSFIASGAALAGWAVSAASETNLSRSNRLVTHGPYALSRHPMYLGWSFIYFGLALVVNTCWLFIFSPLLVALVHLAALNEERKLENRFGKDYQAYEKRVRRYL